jgi:AAA family ATP:ADP antiporter
VLVVASAALVWSTERDLHPRPRPVHDDAATTRRRKTAAAFEGASEVLRSRYLVLIVGIVIAYEFAAAMTDFVVSVVFERAYTDETELAQMFGRLGWIASGVALASQLVIVPLLLPHKRLALLLPPIAMGLASIGLALVPVVAFAIVLSASDRGFNYSLQQATKETLYVPLSDVQKYKAKAFIDMFVDRAGKAISSLALMAVIATSGVSIPISLAVALGAIVVWVIAAALLGPAYARTIAARAPEPRGAEPAADGWSSTSSSRPVA